MTSFPVDDRFLITGASVGIGKSIAYQLNGLGATVIAVGRSEERLSEARSSAPVPSRFLLEPLDLSEGLEELPSWIERLATRVGPLRGFVHSAGTVELAPLKVISIPSARRLFEVNVLSALALTQGFCQPGVHSGRGNSVLFVSSGSSLRGLAGASTYSASKGALNAATRSLARELAPMRIRVNAILPGLVDTPMTRALPATQVDFLLRQQFLRGMIAPEHISAACAFLLSDEGRFITGESLIVDGGGGVKIQPLGSASGATA